MAKKTIEQRESQNKLTVNFSVLDRYYLPTLLPDHGSIAEIELGEAIIDRISFTQKEREEFEIKFQPNGDMDFNPAKNKLCEFHFESFEILYIQQGIRELEVRKMIRPWNKSLAKRMLEIVVKTKNNKEEKP